MKHFIPLVIAAVILFAFSTFAQSYDDLINKAKTEMNADDQTQALVTLKKAYSISNQGAEMYKLMATCYKVTGEFETGILYINRALEMNPKSVQLFMVRAGLYMEQKQLDKAVTDYEFVIRLEPKNAEAHYMAGLIFYNLGSKEKSNEKTARGCKYFRKAKELGEKRAASMLLKCP